MPSRKISPNTLPADRHQALRDRAEQVRDKAGRFIRQKPDAATETAAPSQDPPPLGTVQVRGDAHPDTYGLQVNEGGLGLHAPPGASVIVEPVMPEKAGLAVFYLKGQTGPVIFDLTHEYSRANAGPVAEGSEVVPLIPLCEPGTGIARWLRVDRIEKLHRITGIYTPVEVAEKHRPAPTPLPLMGICPETMGEHYADDTAAYPLVRPGETVIYDPSLREPTHGALCVLQWNSGRRSLLQTNRRQSGGKGALRWWVDPINRPASREALERRLADNSPDDMLHTSDGPFTAEHLQSKIVGTVVGVLVPRLHQPKEGGTQDPDADLLSLRPQWVELSAAYAQALRDAEETCAKAPSVEPPPAREPHHEWLVAIDGWRERTGVTAAKNATSKAMDSLCEIEDRIAAMPATTLAGLKLKALVAQRNDEVAWPDELGTGMVRDILAFEAPEEDVAPLTVEGLAPMPFEAIDIDHPLCTPQEWMAKFSERALALHVADKTLRMSKPELVAFIRDAAGRQNGADEAMFKAMEAAQETLEGWGQFLQTASARYLVAASAMTLEEQAEQQHPETEA